MGCFLVPAAEAVITTIATKIAKAKEQESEAVRHMDREELAESARVETIERIPFSRKIRWLSNLLWGGSGLLAFEHIWYGEVTPWFPFLTATGNPADTAEMLREMATTGVTMSALVTVVWFGMVAAASVFEKREVKEQEDGAETER